MAIYNTDVTPQRFQFFSALQSLIWYMAQALNWQYYALQSFRSARSTKPFLG